MNRKRRDFDVVSEWFQTANAFQFDRLSKMACDPERAFRDTQIERVAERPGAFHALRFQLRNRARFLGLEMQTFGLNLAKMNLHCLSFPVRAFATGNGTNPLTSPPRRAISLTIRELR